MDHIGPNSSLTQKFRRFISMSQSRDQTLQVEAFEKFRHCL